MILDLVSGKERAQEMVSFYLRITCERMMDCQKDLNLCFIDYAKAFNRVNHEKLMEVLAKAGIPSHERRLVCEIYWNQSTKVKLTSGTTEYDD
ncbi:RNA-directed DNA polymerase from mobile element jockey-like [Elysia marginata]|uniref:RNA-directed DNA polymerase from mobile element jockey-like n=1 Tax=Elysia marginata TaxID=1093978 RepID=A0AAV4H5C6_9GAST|nr:RNA-directed DNA polymerase from mobile element jockey-like [Elysia marginata]